MFVQVKIICPCLFNLNIAGVRIGLYSWSSVHSQCAVCLCSPIGFATPVTQLAVQAYKTQYKWHVHVNTRHTAMLYPLYD